VTVVSNAESKLKFRKLHAVAVDNLGADVSTKLVDFLFQGQVPNVGDASSLHQQRDPHQRCRDLLMLLHTSNKSQAFVQLYHAVKADPQLQWLVDSIDELTEHSMTSLSQEQLYSGDAFAHLIIIRRIIRYLYRTIMP